MINAETGFCSFPMCRLAVDKGSGYCLHHKKYFDSPTPKKSKKPIAPVAEKRKVVNKQYKAIKNEMLGKDDRCKIKSPVCTGKAQGLNHKQKRTPKNLVEVENLEGSCNPCNQYIENNTAWAKANGHFISRFKK